MTEQQTASARRLFVLWATLPVIWTEAWLKTWYEVYRGRYVVI